MKILSSIFAQNIMIQSGMRILYKNNQNSKIIECVVDEASPNGKFLKISDTWVSRNDITILSILDNIKE
ncbi:MAG: hypothetical protein PHQ86_01860 [Dehalococcoidales bacterium]|nr:hypothetical protein [Dehalococcoidales bacterium]